MEAMLLTPTPSVLALPGEAKPLDGFIGPRQVTDTETIAEIGRLRLRVWRAIGAEMGPTPDGGGGWVDEHDQHAIHFAVWHGGCLVAAARLCLHERLEDAPDYEHHKQVVTAWPSLPAPIACFNRLVVDPAFQRRGLATALDKIRLVTAKELGAHSVFLTVPRYRVNAIIQLGFQVPCRAAAIDPVIDRKCGGAFVGYKLL